MYCLVKTTIRAKGVGEKDFPRVGNYSKPKVLKEQFARRRIATEWWFWLKEKQGKPEIWNEAKKLFANPS